MHLTKILKIRRASAVSARIVRKISPAPVLSRLGLTPLVGGPKGDLGKIDLSKNL